MKEQLSGLPYGGSFSPGKELILFFSLSLLFHFVLAFFVYSYSIRDQRISPPLFARVVTPEELQGLPGGKPFEGHKGGRAQSIPALPGVRSSSRQPDILSGPDASVPQSSRDTGSPIINNRPEDLIRLPDSLSSVNGVPRDTNQPLARLFDKDVIREQAKKAPEKTPAITFDTREFRYQGYMNRLKEKIEHIWQYPLSAAQRGIYGDLYIRFSIKKDGSLGRVDLIRTSGYRELDDAAIKALMDGAPYWPLPSEWGLDEFIIEGHFIYTLYGYYIR